MSYKTILDVGDGFGDRTPACRENTLPREDQNSGIYATRAGQTTIGPVLQAHIFRYLGMSGIEIQIRSTTTKDLASWVVICRGINRYVEELHQRSRPQSHKFWIAIGKICCKRKRTWFDKDGAINEHRGNSCEAVEKSDESSVQVIRRSYSCWRKEMEWHSWLSTIQRKYFWSRSLKIGTEIVRHDDYLERETDGAVHWKSMGLRSRAVITYSCVSADCIYKVISPKAERTLFERPSTPRPASKIVLKSAWAITAAAAARHIGAFCLGHQETDAKKGTRYANRQHRTTGRQETDAKYWDACWERRAWIFKADHRIEGIAQDVILEDEERMGQIQKMVDKSRTGYHTKSIVEDLEKAEKSIKFPRRIESPNSRIGEHWVARVGTDIQNRPVPILLDAHTGGINLLFLRHFVFDLMRNKYKESKPVLNQW